MNGTEIKKLLVELGVPAEEIQTKLTYKGLEIGILMDENRFLFMVAKVNEKTFDGYYFCDTIIANRDIERKKIEDIKQHPGW